MASTARVRRVAAQDAVGLKAADSDPWLRPSPKQPLPIVLMLPAKPPRRLLSDRITKVAPFGASGNYVPLETQGRSLSTASSRTFNACSLM